jgi:Rieske Fe-S protein
MKATLAKVKNPLESISRRSVLGVMGVGMTGVLVGCNDDLSPLSATLSSNLTEVTATGSVMLTAKLDVGFADTVEFYEGTKLLDTLPILAGQASKEIILDATSNGMHTYITKITSVTGKQAYSNPIDVTVNIATVQPLAFPTISLAASSNSVTANGNVTLTATAAATTGKITKVEFFEAAGLVKTLNTAPFTFTTPTFTTADNATHSYMAKVTTDAASNNTTTSSTVDVLVNIPAPVVSITLSASNTALTAAGKVILTAAVTGGVSSVEFFDGTTSLGVVSAAPFTKDVQITGTPITQTHNFRASSTVAGKPVTSNTVTVSLNIPLPTITLAASTNSVTAAGNVVLTAAVTGGAVTQIEFFEGATSLGVVTASPYTKTIAFTASSPAQSHTYVVKATVPGAPTTVDSPPVNVNVNIGNLAPTVTLGSSSNNVTANGSITLTATTAAKSGTISSVEFFDGATSLGLVTASPYTKTITFTTTSNGTHNYTAKATDSSNNSATSAPVTAVIVNIPTAAPTVSLSSSSNSVTAAGSVTLTAVAAPDAAVTISKVEFYDSLSATPTVPVFAATTAPFTYAPTFAFASNGTHNYTAKATDSSGKSTTSSAVGVTVNIAATPPKIALAANPTSVNAAGSSTLTATVTAGTGTISKVDFYEDTTLLGTKTAAPYTYAPAAYTNANNGTHNYTATVTASDGSVATSAAATVTVNIAASAPPTITLSANPTSVVSAGSSTLTAVVTPGTGTISKVDFYDSLSATPTVPVFSKTAAPYTYAPTYSGSNNGTHNYTATVTASDGSTATSAIASVSVKVQVVTTPGTLIALFTALPAVGSYVNFNHPTSGIKCVLYRAPSTQTGGVNNGSAYYVAYSRKCAHAGTIITRNPSTTNPHTLTCQDHGAIYNLDSNCVPTNSPVDGTSFGALPTIAIKIGVDGIYI